ncbi:MAG TPA: carbohydrate-binding protein [Planctomycetota bacterium]
MRIASLLLAALAGCSAAPGKWPGASTPWKGQAHAIPGTIEAEHYDEGPPGTAYHDVSPKNEGVAYRGETHVDIEGRPDASNLHGIGWTRAGEWLVYTVDVRQAGTYTIEIPVASNKKGGTFHLEFGGVDRSGPIQVPDSGGWTKLVLVKHPGVKLEKGLQVMKLVCDQVGESRSIGDIDVLRFVLQ